jgi:hypothetical protein
VTQARFTLAARMRLRTGRPYGVLLNDMSPVPLRGDFPLFLSVGQTVRIQALRPGTYATTCVQYFYELATSDSREVLAFHWTPEGTAQGIVTFPHLHVGSAVLSESTPVRPREFHRVHIPTGHVGLSSVVRLAITEFSVQPLIDDWESVIERVERESDQ